MILITKTVGFTCGTERIGKYSRRLYTYPSLEIWGQASLSVFFCTHWQVRFLLSPLYSSAPLFRVEHCHSNRRRFAFVGQEGQGGIVATWEATIGESRCCEIHSRAPCTCHGDSLKSKRLARFTRRPGHPPGRAEPLVVSPELLHPHHALRQELLPFLENIYLHVCKAD